MENFTLVHRSWRDGIEDANEMLKVHDRRARENDNKDATKVQRTSKCIANL